MKVKIPAYHFKNGELQDSCPPIVVTLWDEDRGEDDDFVG